MNPNDKWAVPPRQDVGDDNNSSIHEAVGEALGLWENFESLLTMIFMVMLGVGQFSKVAQRAYGSVVAFSGRAEMLKAAADAFFDEHPDDEIEARLGQLIKDARRASTRRNDIAHGTAILLSREAPAHKTVGYFLVPGFYATNKNDLDGNPSYAYTSEQIRALGKAFYDLADPAAQIMVKIAGKHQAQRAGRLPPSTPKNRTR